MGPSGLTHLVVAVMRKLALDNLVQALVDLWAKRRPVVGLAGCYHPNVG